MLQPPLSFITGTFPTQAATIPVSVRLAGVEPFRSTCKDVSRPVFEPDECECTKEDPDGYDDLVLKFETEDIIEAIGEVSTGDVIELLLTGVLNDDTPIEGTDCVLIKGKTVED